MARPLKALLFKTIIRQRRHLRESESAFIALATLAGLLAGLLTNVQQWIAHGIQQLLYGVTLNRLSALGQIHHPWKLLALPACGLALVLMNRWLPKRAHAPVDVVEANALHGGRIPAMDNVVIAGQTILSNGAGASVGLEAAFAQTGGGVASLLGQWLKLRRNDLRTLVGAGAGAAVGAAFGAPLTGAFYAFEIVIGNYTPAAIAPVMAAALGATFVTRALGVEPYLIATTADRLLALPDYLAYGVLGLVCAGVGIAIMRLVTFAELHLHALPKIGAWRPVIGGFLLIPLALLSPQTLSAGHGALHLDLALHPAIQVLALVLLLKVVASVLSLGFGFRGGLFFASLFIGSLVGQIFALLVNQAGLGITLDLDDAALVGMAALTVSVVGGPMTLALLMLETTHDFALMGVVLTATLISSAFTREAFGYSFSTWRLHLRGSNIRSPRDIGWSVKLTAGRLMRRDFVTVREDQTIGSFRQKIALGSASKAVILDADGRYRGIAVVAAAYHPGLDPAAPISGLAALEDVTITPETGIEALLGRFDEVAADELAVVDDRGQVLGVITEKHARRRYFEEVETAQRELFGES